MDGSVRSETARPRGNATLKRDHGTGHQYDSTGTTGTGCGVSQSTEDLVGVGVSVDLEQKVVLSLQSL